MYQIDKISRLFAKYGNSDYIGEPVSQQSHLIQSAMLAEEAGAVQELVVAAFLHDIGHIVGLERNLPSIGNLSTVGNLGTTKHEQVGAIFLRELGFPDYITGLVEQHVNAKRYLVTVNPSYNEKLSEASKQTLIRQGDLMDRQELLEFRNLKFFRDVRRLRSWDEQAKRTDVELKPLEYYLGISQKVL